MIAVAHTLLIEMIIEPLLPRFLKAVPYRTVWRTPRRFYATADRSSDRVATNDPNPPAPVQNVSDSNAVPISPQGLRDSDKPLQEVREDSERQRVMQAPNRQKPWSRSQQPRERAMSGPRFEQTIMEYQVRSFTFDAFFTARQALHGLRQRPIPFESYYIDYVC